METDEVSERYIAPCFVNGLESYDGEINLAFDENLISNEYAVKLCLDYEFMRLVNGIVDFGSGVITVYPEEDPFEDDSEKIEKSMDDWDQLLYFNFDDIPKLDGEELLPFICKMGKTSLNKKRAIENLNLFYPDIGTSLSTWRHLTQEEAAMEALALRISHKFALLEEVRLVLETMAYHDKYKKVLDEIWKGKVELDGMIMKEEEEAINKVKGKALKEKDDPGAFIFPIRLEGKLGREEIKKVDRGITMINHTQAEAMGILTNVLCQVEVTTIIAKFLILDIPIDRDAPIVVVRGFLYTIRGIVNTLERLFSTFDGICHQPFCAARSDVLRTAKRDSDDEEEYEIKRNKFGAPIYGPKPATYLNCNDPAERSLARQAVINPFWKISVLKKAVNFLGSLPILFQHVNWKPDYKGCYTNEEEAKILWEETMMKPDHQDPNALDKTKQWKSYCFHKFIMNSYYEKVATEMRSLEIDDMLRIKLRESESNEEIFTFVAWIRAFNIKEPIYSKLCHGFYSTYEFDKVYAGDELPQIIKFRLGGHAHNLTFDDHFNAQEYWLSISREEDLSLSRSHASTIRNLILRVIHKMITYGLCQRTTGYDKIQKNDLWLLSMFDARHQYGYANDGCGCKVDEVTLRRWYSKGESDSLDLDTTTLRELINSKGRLIPEDLQLGVPRVGILRPPRASMQYLYERMGNMEIHQGAIERMFYRQSYHWDIYAGVFEHMAGVYSVDLQGAYNPPGYAQP
ncbi:hypothetical protein Tco_1440204 [Tanacetum coccineum]